MSDTPLTNREAFILKNDEGDRFDVVLATFSAQLERENNQLRAERDKEHSELIRWMVKASEWCEQHKIEVTQLRADLKQCAEALKLASKDTILVSGDGESALSCIDDKAPTEIAIAAKKALSLPSVQNALRTLPISPPSNSRP